MVRPTPVDEEYRFEQGLIISSTDLRGIITYANRKFCEISGYSKDELKGSNHNIVRHPDMPKAAFQDLWDTIRSGKEWTGIVKNLRKECQRQHSRISGIRYAQAKSGQASSKTFAKTDATTGSTPISHLSKKKMTKRGR